MKRKIRLSRRQRQGGREDCPLVWLRVRDKFGGFAVLRFCLDSGSDVPALPISLARDEGIAFPLDEASRYVASGLVGSVGKYRGVIHVRIFNEDFIWPCDFLETPASLSVAPYGVIGRAGFVEAFDFCMKHPAFTLRRRLSIWRTWATAMFPPWTPEHPVDEPL